MSYLTLYLFFILLKEQDDSFSKYDNDVEIVTGDTFTTPTKKKSIAYSNTKVRDTPEFIVSITRIHFCLHQLNNCITVLKKQNNSLRLFTHVVL